MLFWSQLIFIAKVLKRKSFSKWENYILLNKKTVEGEGPRFNFNIFPLTIREEKKKKKSLKQILILRREYRRRRRVVAHNNSVCFLFCPVFFFLRFPLNLPTLSEINYLFLYNWITFLKKRAKFKKEAVYEEKYYTVSSVAFELF